VLPRAKNNNIALCFNPWDYYYRRR